MALNLDEGLKKRLISILRDCLPNIEVRNGWFIDRSSIDSLLIGDKSLPSQGSIHDKLEKYIGEFPFTDYVNSD